MMSTIITILIFLFGCFSGTLLSWKLLYNFFWTSKELSDKHLALFEASIQWIQLKQQNQKMSDYLLNIGCKKIGIYGMSYLGERLYDELKDSPLNIIYGIDRDIKKVENKGLIVIQPDEIDDRIDTIIITPIMNYEDIRRSLLKHIDKDIKIISLETILFAS